MVLRERALFTARFDRRAQAGADAAD